MTVFRKLSSHLLDVNIKGKKDRPSDSRKHYGLAKVINMDFVEAQRTKAVKAQQLEDAEKERKRQEKADKVTAKTLAETAKKASQVIKQQALYQKRLEDSLEKDRKKRKREEDFQDC
jgi:uncharacterized protein (UPF0332 family)